jgi:hypothetical protein
LSDEAFGDEIADAYAALCKARHDEHAHDPHRVYRAFRNVFGSNDGQFVLKILCLEGGLLYNGGPGAVETPLQHYEGRRHMVNFILHRYSLPPEQKKEVAVTSPLDRN